ncbi:hypothetical protein ACE6H2_007233 [Prunus campanulata]
MELHAFNSAVFLSWFCMHAFIPYSCVGLTHSGNDTDRLALLEVKATITHDPFGVLTTWNETIHFCHWHGVSCGHRHQRVTRLDLQSLELAGSISPHVGNLSFLREIYLQNNSLSSEIPQEIGRLRRLQNLQLENNSLSGEIPSNLSGCSQLLILFLSFNFLVGRIPEELGTLSKLRVLAIDRNNLTGAVPHTLSNLSSLESLSASSNNLNGTVPDFFGHLTNITYLGLSENTLSGMIPPSIFNISSIRFFYVVGNRIQGTLPSNLGTAFPRLEYFHIDNNQFSGFIPVSISNASNIVQLGMSGNQLHGTVPSLIKLSRLEKLVLGINHLGSGGVGDLSFFCDLTNATSLQVLQINKNNFGGMLPQCTANLSSSLLLFFVSANKLFGRIPYGIGNLLNLWNLRLSANQFSGHIPLDLGKLQKLYELDMAMNSFAGNVPSSLGNLTQLTKLYLSYNNLQGNIPSSLAKCHNLMLLSLAYNNLSGFIPQEVIAMSPSYVAIYLQNNRFSGSLPQEVGNLINLEYLSVSDNMLSGKIPANLGQCVRLEYLEMQRNFFQGEIPSSLSSLRGIIEVHLSQNNLSGTIPEFLARFEFLQYLNLSYNNFEGMVPIEGVFKNATMTSVKGNRKLCGGIPEFQLPKCKLQHSNKRRSSTTLKLIISLIGGLLGITFALTSLYLCWFQRKRKVHTSRDSEKFLKVSYQSLLKATDGFSSANLLGTGSFGSVYKGLLEHGETTVAIKVLNLVRSGASKSFFAECEALKNIRHRNLVKVLSACSGSDYRGFDFKALVYEFMVNGSLDAWLHPTPTVGEANQRSRSLTFSQRLNIAIDVAMALNYLHHQCEAPIVHCDVKPSNVLLNADMIGHLGDFGLARFLPRAAKTFSGNQSSSVGVKGTIGYTPPEYGMGHEVWTKGDAYSYGILLLEMFTGKTPTEIMFQGTSNLPNFVKAALPHHVVEVLDPILCHEKEEWEMSTDNASCEDSLRVHNKMEESLISILEIGVACSAELPRERLDICDVVTGMCLIRNKLRAYRICE